MEKFSILLLVYYLLILKDRILTCKKWTDFVLFFEVIRKKVYWIAHISKRLSCELMNFIWIQSWIQLLFGIPHYVPFIQNICSRRCSKIEKTTLKRYYILLYHVYFRLESLYYIDVHELFTFLNEYNIKNWNKNVTAICEMWSHSLCFSFNFGTSPKVHNVEFQIKVESKLKL